MNELGLSQAAVAQEPFCVGKLKAIGLQIWIAAPARPYHHPHPSRRAYQMAVQFVQGTFAPAPLSRFEAPFGYDLQQRIYRRHSLWPIP